MIRLVNIDNKIRIAALQLKPAIGWHKTTSGMYGNLFVFLHFIAILVRRASIELIIKTLIMKRYFQNTARLAYILFVCILIIGLALRFYQFLMGRSMWEDETAAALNFISRDYVTLTKPLDYSWAAAIFFIFIVKTFTLLFGFSEYAFRAFPFIASILTLPLFYYITLELTKSRKIALTGFLIFAVNLSVIYYSSELRPYAIDLSAYLLMIYLAISQHSTVKQYRALLLAIAGSISLLCSNVAFIVLFCIACNMLLSWYQVKKADKKEVVVLLIWLVVFVVNYFLFLYNHPYAQPVRRIFAFAFCPTDILSCEFITFVKQRIEEICFTLLLYVSKAFGFAYVLLLIFIVSVRHIVRKKRFNLFLFLCMPVLLHLFISALKLYPFWYRFILYLVPALIILMALGTKIIADFIASKTWPITGTAFIGICCCFFITPSLQQFPLWFREIKPSINYINQHYPHHKIYITTPYSAYKYYNIRGYAKDSSYEAIQWNITPEKYFQLTEAEQSNYILLHAEDLNTDGYKDVMDDLKKKNLVAREFSYKTYTVSEIKPLNPNASATGIDYKYFDPKQVFDLNGERVVAIWNLDAITRKIPLLQEQYNINVVSKGTPALGAYPHLNVFINNEKIGDYITSDDYKKTSFTFVHATDSAVTIRILMDNDIIDARTNEDRNAFIHNIFITKKN